jgi:rod shape-determining protein MreC
VAVSRRRTRSRLTLLLLVLTSITLLTLDARGNDALVGPLRRGVADVLAPLQSGAAAAVRPVVDAWNGISGYRSLESQNRRLQRSLDDARGQAAASAGAGRQLDALRQLDQIGPSGTRSVVARVVATPASNFDTAVEIDRGQADGVRTGMPILTGAGLVGQVSKVFGHRSQVLLVTDLTSAVGVRLADTGDLAVAEGRGTSNPMKISLVDSRTTVHSGEVVRTSGLAGGSSFPPDIPVGVVRCCPRPGPLEEQIIADPVDRLPLLELVKVLLWTPPAG